MFTIIDKNKGNADYSGESEVMSAVEGGTLYLSVGFSESLSESVVEFSESS